jgi:hypothetical protein
LTEKQDQIALMKLKHEKEIERMGNKMTELEESNREILQLLKYPEKLLRISQENK